MDNVQKYNTCSMYHRPCLIKGESVGLSVCPPIFAKQELGKDVSAVMKNF
jgi:hypothetical protein